MTKIQPLPVAMNGKYRGRMVLILIVPLLIVTFLLYKGCTKEEKLHAALPLQGLHLDKVQVIFTSADGVERPSGGFGGMVGDKMPKIAQAKEVIVLTPPEYVPHDALAYELNQVAKQNLLDAAIPLGKPSIRDTEYTDFASLTSTYTIRVHTRQAGGNVFYRIEGLVSRPLYLASETVLPDVEVTRRYGFEMQIKRKDADASIRKAVTYEIAQFIQDYQTQNQSQTANPVTNR